MDISIDHIKINPTLRGNPMATSSTSTNTYYQQVYNILPSTSEVVSLGVCIGAGFAAANFVGAGAAVSHFLLSKSVHNAVDTLTEKGQRNLSKDNANAHTIFKGLNGLAHVGISAAYAPQGVIQSVAQGAVGWVAGHATAKVSDDFMTYLGVKSDSRVRQASNALSGSLAAYGAASLAGAVIDNIVSGNQPYHSDSSSNHEDYQSDGSFTGRKPTAFMDGSASRGATSSAAHSRNPRQAPLEICPDGITQIKVTEGNVEVSGAGSCIDFVLTGGEVNARSANLTDTSYYVSGDGSLTLNGDAGVRECVVSCDSGRVIQMERAQMSNGTGDRCDMPKIPNPNDTAILPLSNSSIVTCPRITTSTEPEVTATASSTTMNPNQVFTNYYDILIGAAIGAVGTSLVYVSGTIIYVKREAVKNFLTCCCKDPELLHEFDSTLETATYSKRNGNEKAELSLTSGHDEGAIVSIGDDSIALDMESGELDEQQKRDLQEVAGRLENDNPPEY